MSIHERLVESLKARAVARAGKSANAFGYGIGLAEAYVARAFDELGFGETIAGAKRADILAASSGKLVYCQPELEIFRKTTRSSQFAELLPDGIKAPDNTLLVFQNVVTTPRIDRDKDVLETSGGMLDPKAPLLWQHLYNLPLGPVLATIEHTPKALKVACAIVDVNDLTSDAAKFVEAGVLRISHGFRALEWDQRKAEPGDAMGEPGYHITKFEIMEVSLVSVPSNVDAVIEMYAKGSLSSDVAKAWARKSYDARHRSWRGVTLDDASQTAVAPSGVKRVVIDDATPANETEEPAIDSGDVDSIWGKSIPGGAKAFDVQRQNLEASRLEYEWVSRYLGTEIKNVTSRDERASGVWVGTFLYGVEEALVGLDAKQDDLRNLTDDGKEMPPEFAHVELNSKTSRSFVVEGLRFFKTARGHLVVKTYRTWHGVGVCAYAADQQLATDVIDSAWALGHQKNLLRYEAFSLSGEFLPATSEKFDGLFLTPENEASVKRIVRLLNEKGGDLPNRGMILAGPPGTGKTLSSRIVRNEANATFVWIAARDFSRFGAYGTFGMAFDLAKALGPCVLCFEDIDSWIDGYSVDLLKTELDGVGRSRGIVTMLSTNHHQRLPKALVDRPGRFHDVLVFDLPDDATRAKMIERWLPELPDESRARVVEQTKGYAGAHVFELCYFARVLGDDEKMAVDAAVDVALKKISQARELVGAKSGESLQVKAARPVAYKRLAFGVKSAETPSGVAEAAPPLPTADETVLDGSARVPDASSGDPGDDTAEPTESGEAGDGASETGEPLVGTSGDLETPKQSGANVRKAGRVLSEKNLTALKECQQDMEHVIDNEELSRSGLALMERCVDRIKTVISTAQPEVGPVVDPALAGQASAAESLSAKSAFSLALTLSSKQERRRWRAALDSVVARDEDDDVMADLM
jgi:hypothetical protein